MKVLMAIVFMGAAAAASAHAPQGSVERGRQTYLAMGCQACHGTVGQGGERGAGPMPRYPLEHLTDQQLADIYTYVASIVSNGDRPYLKGVRPHLPIYRGWQTKSISAGLPLFTTLSARPMVRGIF